MKGLITTKYTLRQQYSKIQLCANVLISYVLFQSWSRSWFWNIFILATWISEENGIWKQPFKLNFFAFWWEWQYFLARIIELNQNISVEASLSKLLWPIFLHNPWNTSKIKLFEQCLFVILKIIFSISILLCDCMGIYAFKYLICCFNF